jgi:hypothetical protein
MGSKRIKQLKVEAIANGSKRLIDGLKGTTTNTKFITLSSSLQTAALTTPRGGIISLALTANTLKFGLPSIFHSKDGNKTYIMFIKL